MYFYLHIPFCRQKCPYCKFALTPVFDSFKKKRYIKYVQEEIGEYFRQNPSDITTLYFGWWTPSVLSLEEVKDILESFPAYRSAQEISFESNPEDITYEYARWLFDLWINRLSLGVQTLNDISLKEIHRSNRTSIIQALTNISKARQLSSLSIYWNIDFILGLPHVKPGETLLNIQEMHQLFHDITHTSVYMLEDELYPKHWKSLSIWENSMQWEFLEIIEYFQWMGWSHYELSNFSKPGSESVHNRSYWDHSNYRGFGLSASSFMDGKRWSNSASFSGYYQWKITDEEHLTPEQLAIEKMMFWLRRDGILESELPPKYQNLIAKWLLEQRGMRIVPTKTWIFLLDYIMSELV